MSIIAPSTAFTLDLLEIVEEAFERCGAEPRSGYDFRTARRSINLLFADWANRGLNMWTMDSGTLALTAGSANYTLPADTIDVLDCTIRANNGATTTQNDRTLSRVSQSVYSTIPNKLIPGTPNQMTVSRLRDAPVITLYPVPNDSTAKLVYWRLRRIATVAGGADTHDIPFRMLPALTSGLAYYLSFKIPGAMERSQALKAVYDEDFQRASDEDREKAPVRFIPRIGRL